MSDENLLDEDETRKNIKRAEWRGYTLKALEDMNQEIQDMKIEIRETNENIEKLDDKIGGMRIKMAGIGATTAFLVSFSILLAQSVI